MSWIIQSLLNSGEEIKERADIDSDEFNDLMLIEKAIEILHKNGTLSDEDVEFLSGIGKESPEDKKTRGEKLVVSKKFNTLTEKIAEYMGDYFTDEGYLSYMKTKYSLNEEQVDTLRLYIKSEYKNKIMRKPLNDKQQ